MRVRLVGVKVDGLVDRSEVWAQLELGLPEVAWQKAERAMDKASDRFGDGAVRPARLVTPDDNS